MPDGKTELEWTLKAGQVEQKLKAIDALQENVNKTFGRTTKAVGAWEQQLRKTEKAAASDAWTQQLKKTTAAREVDAARAIALDKQVAQERISAFVNAERVIESKRKDYWAAQQQKSSHPDAFAMQLQKTSAAQMAAARSPIDAFINAKGNGGGGDMSALTTPKVDYMALQRSKTNDARDTQRLATLSNLSKRQAEYDNLLAAGQKKVQAELKATAAAAKGTGDSLEDAGQSGAKAFGIQALGSLAQYATAAGLVGLAVRKIGEGLEFANQQREAASQSVKDDLDVIAGITELSDTDAEVTDRLKAYQNLRTKHGLTREQAASIQETAISTGNEASMERFAGTRAAGDQAERMASAAKLETLFGGKLTEVQADAALVAASIPSQVKATGARGMAMYAPKAAETISQIGSSPTEVMAAYSVFADKFKGAETGAERLNILQAKLGHDERFKGMGVDAAMRKLMAMPESAQKGFYKENTELEAAYFSYAQNTDEIAKRRKFIDDKMGTLGTDEDFILQKQTLLTNNPMGRASLENRIAEEETEAAGRDAYGIDKLRTDSEVKRIERDDIRAGKSGLRRFASWSGAGFANWLGADPETARNAGKVSEYGTTEAAAAASGPVAQSLFKMQQLLENIDRTNSQMAAQRSGRTPEPTPPRR